MSAAAMTSVGNQLVDPTVASTVDAGEATYLEQIIANGQGSSFVNTGTECLVVRNTGAGDNTITITTQKPDNMGTLVNPVAGSVVITIPDAGSAVIGPFDPKVFTETVVVVSSHASEVVGYVTEVIAKGNTLTAYRGAAV